MVMHAPRKGENRVRITGVALKEIGDGSGSPINGLISLSACKPSPVGVSGGALQGYPLLSTTPR
jgi:hypothetical protein